MKYIKLFMLVLTAALFAACSDDDVNYNSNSGVTLEFTTPSVTVRENAGIIQVPVKITGKRNGNVHFTVTTAGTGANPAKEGTDDISTIADCNYMMTTKTYNVNVDTLSESTVNVEVKLIDDTETNDDRQFTITIASADGATIGTNSVATITVRDNDGSFYSKFAGTWTLSGVLQTSSGTNEFSSDVTISTATDDAEYEKVLYVSAPGLIDVGVSLDVNFPMDYLYNEDSQDGTMSIVCGKEVASYGSSYSWIFATAKGQSLSTDPLVADWAAENGNVPSVIDFGANELYFYGGSSDDPGVWAIFSNLKLTKK